MVYQVSVRKLHGVFFGFHLKESTVLCSVWDGMGGGMANRLIRSFKGLPASKRNSNNNNNNNNNNNYSIN